MRPWRALALVLPLAVAACGPIPVDRAEEACFEQIGPAPGVRGTAAMGVGSDGLITDIDVEFTASNSRGDPAAAYEACVYRKSGQLPRRPLYDRPDWRG